MQAAPVETGINRIVNLEHNGRQITLIGLADHSPAGLAEADRVLADLSPDSVCLELCETRRRILEDVRFWEEATILETLRRGRGLLLLANLAAATWMNRMGYQDPPRHGAHMPARKEEAEKLGAEVYLADRDLHITLKRAWHLLSRKRKFGMICEQR